MCGDVYRRDAMATILAKKSIVFVPSYPSTLHVAFYANSEEENNQWTLHQLHTITVHYKFVYIILSNQIIVTFEIIYFHFCPAHQQAFE